MKTNLVQGLGGHDLYIWIAGSFYVCFVWEGRDTCYSESLK